jgi:hypothetical protein
MWDGEDQVSGISSSSGTTTASYCTDDAMRCAQERFFTHQPTVKPAVQTSRYAWFSA